ncbi:hypothetical protein LEP1GSC018_1396 [Leptospira kirschneri str. 2008720114]|nr:hypothetical protein LEP1GSC018_1396 [Leptospira kirschneri str. 2008720114]
MFANFFLFWFQSTSFLNKGRNSDPPHFQIRDWSFNPLPS